MATPIRYGLTTLGAVFAKKRGMLLFNDAGLFLTLMSTTFVISFCRLHLQYFYVDKTERDDTSFKNAIKVSLLLASGWTAFQNIQQIFKELSVLSVKVPPSNILTSPSVMLEGDVKVSEKDTPPSNILTSPSVMLEGDVKVSEGDTKKDQN